MEDSEKKESEESRKNKIYDVVEELEDGGIRYMVNGHYNEENEPEEIEAVEEVRSDDVSENE